MKTVTALSQSPQTKIPSFAAQNAAMNSRKWYQLGMQLALPLIYQESEKSEFASIETVTIDCPMMPGKQRNIAATHAAQKHDMRELKS